MELDDWHASTDLRVRHATHCVIPPLKCKKFRYQIGKRSMTVLKKLLIFWQPLVLLFIDYSLHCCNKCKGLFVMPEEKNRHQLTCTANPFKASCTHFACERKMFLQVLSLIFNHCCDAVSLYEIVSLVYTQWLTWLFLSFMFVN